MYSTNLITIVYFRYIQVQIQLSESTQTDFAVNVSAKYLGNLANINVLTVTIFLVMHTPWH